MMDARVKRLEYEHKRALISLQRTIDTNERADQMRLRRINDLEYKNDWLSFENQALSERRARNAELREERKKNIEDQRT